MCHQNDCYNIPKRCHNDPNVIQGLNQINFCIPCKEASILFKISKSEQIDVQISKSVGRKQVFCFVCSDFGDGWMGQQKFEHLKSVGGKMDAP